MVNPGWTPVRLVLALAVVGILPSQAIAQGRVGGQGVYQSELFGGAFGVGARAQLDLDFLFPGVSALGTYDTYFPDCDEDCSLWEASGSLLFSSGPGFYFGAGAAFQRYEPPEGLEALEDWIANFVVGFTLPGTSFVTPFVDARFEAFSETTNQIVFSAGALVGPTPRSRRPGGRR